MKIGELFVDLRLDTGVFNKELSAAMKKARTTAGDIAVKIKVDADTRPATASIKKLTTAANKITIKVDADTTMATNKIARLQNASNKATIQVDADTTRAKGQIDKLASVRNRATIQIDADTARAQAEIAKLSTVRNRATVQVDADVARATSSIRGVQAAAEAVDRASPTVRVDADTARAQAGLRSVKQEADGLNGKGINLNVGGAIAGVISLQGALAGIAPLAVSATAALAPMVGLLGALPGLALGVGQSVGALALAFHGIGAAIKETGTAHQATASTAAKSGATQVASASAIKSAEEGVASAMRSVANVRRDNAEAARQDNQRIKDAVRDLAAAHRDASQQQQDDLRDIADAQKDAQRAQEDLNDARRQAVKDLEDLNEAAGDSTLDRRQAELDYADQLEETNKILADSTKTAREKAQAQLDLEKAQDRLDDANKREAETAKEAEDANKKGIEGSKGVKDAKQALADAEQRIDDAKKQRQRDAAEANDRIEAAERALDDARRQQHANALDRADALKSAQAALAQSQRALADAHKQGSTAMDTATTSAANLTKAYDALSPAGKAFVDQFNEVKKTLKGVGDAIAAVTLPHFTAALKDVNDALPDFQGSLVKTGDVIGTFVEHLAGLVTGPLKKQLIDIFDNNNKALEDFLGAKNNGGLTGLAIAFVNIADAAQPLVRWMGDLFNKFGKWAGDTAKLNNENGKMAEFFRKARETAEKFGSILGNVFTAIFEIGHAAFPSGTGLLDSIDKATEKFAKWAGTPAAQAKLKRFFEDMADIWRTVGDTLTKIVEKLGPMLAQVADFAAKHPKLVAGAVVAGGVAQSPVGGAIGGALGPIAGGLAAGGGRLALGGLLGGGAEAGGIGALTGALAPLAAILLPLIAAIAAWKMSPDFRRIVGGEAAKAFKDVKDAFAPLADKFTEFWEKNGPWISNIGNLWAIGFGTEIGGLFRALGGAFSLLADSIGIILDLLNGDWPAAWQGMSRVVADVGDILAGLFTAIFSGPITIFKEVLAPWLGSLGSTIWGFVGPSLTAFASPFMTVWSTIWGALAPIVTGALGIITGLWQTFFTTLSTVASTAWGLISSAFTTGLGLARTVVTTVLTGITTYWSTFFTGLRTVASTVWTAISVVFSTVLGAIRTTVSTVTTAVSTVWRAFFTVLSTVASTVWAAIRNTFSTVLAAIRSVVSTVTAAIQSGWSTFLSTIRTAASTVWSAISSTFSTVLATIRSTVSTVTGAISSGWTTFFSGLRSTASTVMTAISSAISTTLGAIQTGFSNAVGAVKTAWDKLKKAAADPVKFVVDTVYNDHLRVAINKVLGLLPGDHSLDPVSVKGLTFAEGGWTGPGSKYQPAGIVHADEHVWTKEEMKKFPGGHQAMEGIRERVRRGYSEGGKVLPGYFLGGGVKPAAGAVSQHSGYPWAKWAGDINEPGDSDIGHPVVAYKAGQISAIKIMETSYGHHIRMNNDGGENTLYAHLSKILVHVGQKVAAGQKIGEKGGTGNVTGPHLHFELAGGSNSIDAGDTGGGGGGPSAPDYSEANSLKDKRDEAFSLFHPEEWMKTLKGMSGFGKIIAEPIGHWVGQAKSFVSDKFGGLISAAIEKAKSVFNSLKDAAGAVGDFVTGDDGGGKGHLSPSQAKSYAKGKMPGSWSWPALEELWEGESGWRWWADNPSSSAYGIPQALPGSKMGSGWHDDAGVQIRWGLNYIGDRYGNSQKALASWKSRSPHWYDQGGWLQEGRTMAVNQSGQPEAVLTGSQWNQMERMIALLEKQQGAAGSSAPFIGQAIIRENVDLESYERQRAFRERATRV